MKFAAIYSKAKFSNQKGLSFLLLIFVMTALVGVGTAIYTFTTAPPSPN